MSDLPKPGQVVITIDLPDISVYASPWALEEVAQAVKSDYFNYPGAVASAAIVDSPTSGNPKPDNWKTSPCAAGKHDRCGIYGSREDCTCECHAGGDRGGKVTWRK